jgi:hypothetical protein
MMQALIEAHPEWADQQAFERDRERLLNFGVDIGLSVEEMFAIKDPDRILALWDALQTMDAELAD